MTDFKRTVKCTGCGLEADVYINSRFDLREFMLSGKCSSCGNSMQLNFSTVEVEQPPAQETRQENINLDDSIFGTEQTSTLSDIMDD